MLTVALPSQPGVVGTAQGLGPNGPCIKVYVARKSNDLLKQIPTEIEGYTVVIEETGEFKSLDGG